jgi:pimeloyl-ACP methyl ester carboxylesterase
MATLAAKKSLAKQWASTITSAAAKPLKHLRASDLRAAAQLATTATSSVARMAEGVNQAVWSTLGAPSGKAADQTRGITGLAFQSVQSITGLVGKGVDTALAALLPFIAPPSASTQAPPTSNAREAVLAALNGVLGDHLEATGNALATPMTLRYAGNALNWQAMPPKNKVTGKVLLLVHGLCMNDLQWRNVHAAGTADERVVDHGATLATALGYTPVYLRYNTGLHTSINGRELSQQLEQLVQFWPKRISELTIVVHSMGGLVTRSAVHTAQADNAVWLKKLKNIVFLGTPHHGALLEKAGNWVDIILGSTPYSKPFAKIAQLRSAGITDLRYGHVVDADWVGKDRFRRQPDSRQPVPLPEGVACYTVAGTTAGQRSALTERLVGDGLVTLPSALGQHTEAQRSLKFAKTSQRIVYRTNHMQLLSSDEVGAQLVAWLGR